MKKRTIATHRATREMVTLVPRRKALPFGVSPAATTRARAFWAATMRAMTPASRKIRLTMNLGSGY